MWRLSGYQGPDLLALNHAADVPVLVHVEDDHWEVIVLAEADGAQIHHFEALSQDLHVCNLVVFDGIFYKDGIGTVDTFNFGSLKQNVGLDLHGAKARRRVGGEEWVSDAGRENDNAALLQMPNGSTADVGFSHLIHENGTHDAALNAALLERILESNGVDHR